jgi:hypothetical protein
MISNLFYIYVLDCLTSGQARCDRGPDVRSIQPQGTRYSTHSQAIPIQPQAIEATPASSDVPQAHAIRELVPHHCDRVSWALYLSATSPKLQRLADCVA